MLIRTWNQKFAITTKKQPTDSETDLDPTVTESMTKTQKQPTDSESGFDPNFAYRIRASIANLQTSRGDVEDITKGTKGLSRKTVHKYLTVFGDKLNVIRNGDIFTIKDL